MRHARPELFAALLLCTLPVYAGVVVTEILTEPDGKTKTRTTYTQGHLQKVDEGTSVTITDLDKGTMLWLDHAKKVATEVSLGFTAQTPALTEMAKTMKITFKANGKRQTVAGHACDEFVSVATVMGSEVTSTSCVSKTAPGATEYAAYGRRLMERSGMKAAPGDAPEGMTLSTESRTRMGMPPGVPPEFVKMMQEQIAKQGPQVSRTVVTAVRSEPLPAATFALPAGYTIKKQ